MSKLEEIKGRLTVSGVTCRVGQEGHEYKATINWDGRKVGSFRDSTTGGEPHIEITDEAVHKILFEASQEKAKEEDYQFLLKLQFNHNFPSGDLLGGIIYPLMEAADMEKRQLAQLKRWCKNKIIIATDKPGEYTTINLVYNREKHKAQLEAKYPGREIINERFL